MVSSAPAIVGKAVGAGSRATSSPSSVDRDDRGPTQAFQVKSNPSPQSTARTSTKLRKLVDCCASPVSRYSAKGSSRARQKIIPSQFMRRSFAGNVSRSRLEVLNCRAMCFISFSAGCMDRRSPKVHASKGGTRGNVLCYSCHVRRQVWNFDFPTVDITPKNYLFPVVTVLDTFCRRKANLCRYKSWERILHSSSQTSL